jgi:hypothetical protein
VATQAPSANEPPSQPPVAISSIHKSPLTVRIRRYVAVALCLFFSVLVFACKASLFRPEDGVRCRVAGTDLVARNSMMAKPSGCETHIRSYSVRYPDLVDTGGRVLREPLAIGDLVYPSRQIGSPRSPPSHQS